MATAYAEPKPSQAALKKKLDKLNEQVDQLVEKYNQANEDLKAARAKLKATQTAAQREQATFEETRKKVAEMAATAYKNGDAGDVATMLGNGDPQVVLDQSAIFAHLSRNRSSELTLFLAAAQRLQRQQAQAQNAFNDVNVKVKDLAAKKKTVEASITKQKKLLGKSGERPGTGGGGGSGGTYNGPASGPARKALQWAYSKIGTPYQYGGTGPRYDCSGFTMRAWEAAGVSLPRTTYSQYAAVRKVAKSNLQPGDLVFFRGLGHMGMYVGNGQMIHSPRTGKSVEVVSITSGYYQSNWYGAGRP